MPYGDVVSEPNFMISENCRRASRSIQYHSRACPMMPRHHLNAPGPFPGKSFFTPRWSRRGDPHRELVQKSSSGNVQHMNLKRLNSPDFLETIPGLISCHMDEKMRNTTPKSTFSKHCCQIVGFLPSASLETHPRGECFAPCKTMEELCASTTKSHFWRSSATETSSPNQMS